MENFEKQFNQPKSSEDVEGSDSGQERRVSSQMDTEVVSESEPGENFLNKPPEKITGQEIQEEESNLSFSFASDERRVNVGYNHGKPFLEVEFYHDLPAELSKEERGKFTKTTRTINGVLREIYVLRTENARGVDESVSYDPKDTGEFHAAEKLDYTAGMFGKYALNNRQELEEIFKANIVDEKLAQAIFEQVIGFAEAGKPIPREILATISPEDLKNIGEQIRQRVEGLKPSPKKIDTEKLAEIINGKRIIFYTGAGISIAADVAGMDDLKKGLGIDMKIEVDGFTHGAATNPEEILKKWKEFADAAVSAKPTEAHKALTEIAKQLGCQILTTNVDALHEQTGVKAIHTTGQWQKLGIRPEWLKEIDVIVVFGLASDVKGFLGWYRENNPDGIIIGANINQPSYLGNQDYLLEGDIQKTLPDLAKEISQR
jgi:hypothetical protein